MHIYRLEDPFLIWCKNHNWHVTTFILFSFFLNSTPSKYAREISAERRYSFYHGAVTRHSKWSMQALMLFGVGKLCFTCVHKGYHGTRRSDQNPGSLHKGRGTDRVKWYTLEKFHLRFLTYFVLFKICSVLVCGYDLPTVLRHVHW
jgi:hypothetical protein